MNELNFIKWKGLITKSINDWVVWAWFECSVILYEKLHKYIDKALTLSIEYNWTTIELDCNICTDNSTYLQFVKDHGVVKLDIIMKDILLSWFIIAGNIKLIIN